LIKLAAKRLGQTCAHTVDNHYFTHRISPLACWLMTAE
jgi:hypothetical protein